MKHVVSSPVKNQTPSSHPVELIKVSQTNLLSALGDERASIVTNIVQNMVIVRITAAHPN